MRLHRLVIAWSGAPVVGSAVTVLHFDGTNQTEPPVAAIRGAFSAAAAVLPNTVTLTFPNSGDTINDTDGTLAGVWTSSGGGTVQGATNGNCAAGVGACIGWTTATIVNGSKGPRKLRGRTFVVPLVNSSYNASGVIEPASLTALTNLGTAILAAGAFAVWHRPLTAGATNGTSGPVVSSKVRNKVAYLSSRRD